MNTTFWGPSGWIFFHTTSLSYNSAHQCEYKTFYKLIGEILPCRFCRDSYKNFIKEEPLEISSQYDLFKWTYNMHNKVNNKLRNQGFLNDKDPLLKNAYNQYNSIIMYKFIEALFIVLFSISVNYTVSDEKTLHYAQFFNVLSIVLPFESLRLLWKRFFFQKNSWLVYMKSPESLIEKVYEFYVLIYNKLKIPYMTYDEILDKYLSQKAGCNKKDSISCRL